MAGLISKLFGGQDRPPDPDPLPGVGGYAMPTGPYGATALPGSTSAAPHPLPQAIGTTKLPRRLGGPPVRGVQVRQSSYRGDTQNPIAATQSPTQTPTVATPQNGPAWDMQNNAPDREFFGGPMLKTSLGKNDTAGGELSRKAQAAAGSNVHVDPRDTTTLWADAQPVIGQGVPGANNVRNEVAQRYKNRPGDMHTYQSAPRGDQANPNNDWPNGWEMGGAGGPGTASGVTVPSRFTFAPGSGSQTWSVERRMPYTGRGDGARGADLNGNRYYGVGGYDNFANGQVGGYGQPRMAQKTPVSFQEPAPWSSNIYTTTQEVGTPANPGPQSQAPTAIYVSPGTSRATNRVTRR